jgi:salicylate hydroxylase
MEQDHGSPYYHIHRADYHAMLLRLARAAPGVRIRLGAAVRDVQPDPALPGGPSVTLASGEVLHADVIVGADGVKSTLQKAVTGLNDAPMPTGDAAYRAIICTDPMLQDPELRPFVETPEMTAWMAPGRHLMAYNIVSSYFLNILFLKRNAEYPLARCALGKSSEKRWIFVFFFSVQRAKKEYNLVLIHPDDGSVESWTEEGSGDKMRADFADFEPRCVTIPEESYYTMRFGGAI